MILRFWVWVEYREGGVCQLSAAFTHWFRASAWVSAQMHPGDYHIVDTGSAWRARETNRLLAGMEAQVGERIALRRAEKERE